MAQIFSSFTFQSIQRTRIREFCRISYVFSKAYRVKALDEHFRLDLLLKEIYYNNV